MMRTNWVHWLGRTPSSSDRNCLQRVAKKSNLKNVQTRRCPDAFTRPRCSLTWPSTPVKRERSCLRSVAITYKPYVVYIVTDCGLLCTVLHQMSRCDRESAMERSCDLLTSDLSFHYTPSRQTSLFAYRRISQPIRNQQILPQVNRKRVPPLEKVVPFLDTNS